MTGVKRFEDLECHQLAYQIRARILQYTRRTEVRQDYKFAHQIRDSARSAPRNLAEGFSRFNPTEIHQYASWAKASLDETKNHVVDAVESGYFTVEEGEALKDLIGRAIGKILKWMKYLDSATARRFYAKFRAQRQATEYLAPGQKIPIPRARRSPPVEPEPRTENREPGTGEPGTQT